MNQDQQFLLKNLQNMIKYIQQETEKKVQIIKKEAIRDADLEKSKLIHPEKEKIRNRILKELDEYKTSMKIAQSQKMNKLRLEKLKVKIDCVNNVFDDARSQLLQRIKNKPEEYKTVLQNLVVQGLIKLLEENVNVICKKEDVELLTSVIESAKGEFLELLKSQSQKFKNFKCNVTIDAKYNLPEGVIGGVMVTAMKSKIRVDNTLDKRLELLKQTATPEIRHKLFKNSD